ncbi:ATP-binding protein [Archangium gephyra]|uniref:HD domain-containing protein n=1 Tax=Archangium gephyra TaxID=48 RepID=UPI0035D4A7BD
MKLLDSYANGNAAWDGEALGPQMREACRTLHSAIIGVVNKFFAPYLDRVTTREMEAFTLHDRVHGRKVAHLMWHILTPERRQRLTPPEIGMLLIAAHLHDLGMGLSPTERNARLSSSSDLWERLQLDESTRENMEKLALSVGNEKLSIDDRRHAERQLEQAREALLCQDTRERHATRIRYEEILHMLEEIHRNASSSTPDISAALGFDSDSYREKIIDICVSHNEDALVLVQPDPNNPSKTRFPRDYPVGRCNADLHLIAATLRLADILDFDRERTPPSLFYYLLPSTLAPTENRSVLEWRKHLAISNWNIDSKRIVFKGRCNDHIVHHAVVGFCETIKREIENTRSTFIKDDPWPFLLPSEVEAEIFEDGYRYVPYRFDIDAARINEILLGHSIYENPLDAVRELIQNAVDACKLLDAHTLLQETTEPRKSGRIFVRYEEPLDKNHPPRLIISDRGTGMDQRILENYFLKLGRSYYKSTEFNQTRIQLRARGVDFAPVSEFGIGFLSSFLLADRIEVKTALWESEKGDTRKRTLQIDGPTRLIRLRDEKNDGVSRFKGTEVTLHLKRGSRRDRNNPPSWAEIKMYLETVCIQLPYTLHLVHSGADGIREVNIEPQQLSVSVPLHLEPFTLRIPVNDPELGLNGEIAISNARLAKNAIQQISRNQPLRTEATSESASHEDGSVLLRGGFKISGVPGLPSTFTTDRIAGAKLELTFEKNPSHRYLAVNLARTKLVDEEVVEKRVLKAWLSKLLDMGEQLHEGYVYHLEVRGTRQLRPRRDILEDALWLQDYSAYQIYRLGRLGWQAIIRDSRSETVDDDFDKWERGEGGALRILSFEHELHWRMLDLVMPRVTRLKMGEQGSLYLAPPCLNWRERLESCRDFISVPMGWGDFVEYIGHISGLLLYRYAGSRYINLKFKERVVAVFEREEEVAELVIVLDKVVYSRELGRQANLGRQEMEIFNRAVDAFGELHIGGLQGSWSLKSFVHR